MVVLGRRRSHLSSLAVPSHWIKAKTPFADSMVETVYKSGRLIRPAYHGRRKTTAYESALFLNASICLPMHSYSGRIGLPRTVVARKLLF